MMQIVEVLGWVVAICVAGLGVALVLILVGWALANKDL